ncbi:response regulator [Ramlibacter sp. XY19]|uniref:ATP-binding protein n=1 Tax=Ramlibacter paludis TaxID=2908000 RepID=UPI0023DB6857|nr:ATP-binding protein [Ramlibacter paludis]MCG2594459.1 response regulator [Ramlibacter paludis]
MPPTSGEPAPYADIFVGTGEMAQLMRRHDWAATPLGPPERWPQALKVALRILLTSKFEMWLGWGPEVHFFYNDAYRPTLGAKHPRSLAMPTRELWAEIWDDIRGRIEAVYERGESTWDRALPLVLERSGYREETYHTFSYSPLIGDTGQVEGLFCAVSEETDRVISERRLGTLRELARDLAAADTRAAVLDATRDALARSTRDLTFSVVYAFDNAGRAQLATAAGVAPGSALAPAQAVAGGHWQPERVITGERSFTVELRDSADVPTGSWDRAATLALVVPISRPGSAAPAGFLACGVSPYRRLDADYIAFVQLVAGQVAASLANAEQVERRTAEADRLRAIFNKAPGFFGVLAGPQHRFQLVNESYRALVGRRELEGRTVAEALPEVAGQGFVDLLDRVYESRQPYVGRSVEVQLQQTPGGPMETRYVDFVYQPILDAGGACTGIFVEGSDVTDKVEAEKELRSLNANLEARIEERTHDLQAAVQQLQDETRERQAAEEALRQAQKMEAVGQLTGGIAHDFNNLLQGIMGSLDLLKLRLQLGKLENIDKLMAGAMHSAERAAGLTHRLLAFSRRQPLDPRPVKANQLVATMEELLRRTLGETIRLELVLAGGLWTTLCDPHQLESAILNLCINARDAMPDGGVLTIETSNAWLDDMYVQQQRDVQAGQYVCISVTDTGVGMAPDVLAKAFDPFFTTKPIGQGTGLGLSMIYGFARQSAGHARLYSEPGQGTTARLYLPRHRGEAEAPEPVPQLGEEHQSLHGEVVLVVEDEAVVRALVIDVLAGLGYRTLEAADGADALRILETGQRIDLLVTDVGLPVMNGRQVYDAAVATRPGLKVLFMTGYAENATLGKGLLAPGMAMITKPFSMEKLASRIVGLLGHEEGAASA